MAPSAAGRPIMSAVSHMLDGSRINPSASATFTSWYFSVAVRTSASVGSPGPGESSAAAGRTKEAVAAAVARTIARNVVFMNPPWLEGAIEAEARGVEQGVVNRKNRLRRREDRWLLRERLERHADQECADSEAEAGDEEPGIAVVGIVDH